MPEGVSRKDYKSDEAYYKAIKDRGGSTGPASSAAAYSEPSKEGAKLTGHTGGFVPPKQEPGEDPGAYGKRVRKAREAHDAAMASEPMKPMMKGMTTDDAAMALSRPRKKE